MEASSRCLRSLRCGENCLCPRNALTIGVEKRDRVLVLTVRVGCRLAPYHPPSPTTRKVTISLFLVVVTYSHQDEVDLKDHQSAQKERRASSVSPEQDSQVPDEALAQAAEDERHDTRFTLFVVFITLYYSCLLISSAQLAPPRMTSCVPSIMKLPTYVRRPSCPVVAISTSAWRARARNCTDSTGRSNLHARRPAGMPTRY